MARTTASKSPADTITRGSGNVFADLGLPDAEALQTKLKACLGAERGDRSGAPEPGCCCSAARPNQPKVSALRNYKLEGFSVERLMTLLTTLDQDVEIVIRKKPRSRAAARISVVAA